MAMLATVVCLQAGMAQEAECINVGFSRSLFGEINENDAQAVIKIWATELLLAEDLPVNIKAEIYRDVREIETALKQNRVDILDLSITEFVDLQHLLDRKEFIFPVSRGTITQEYLLLAPRKSRIADIKDLKGGSLRCLKNARTALSIIWLDVELARTGLPAAEHFFNRVVPVDKVSAALLPVFFGKADACLVTRKGFDIMAELNPQILHQLNILAASRKYISNFLAFNKNYQSKFKDVILNRIEAWDQAPAGRQILTIFQTDALTLKPFETLGSEMELIKEYQRLFRTHTGIFRPESKTKAGKFNAPLD